MVQVVPRLGLLIHNPGARKVQHWRDLVVDEIVVAGDVDLDADKAPPVEGQRRADLEPVGLCGGKTIQ